MAVAKSFENFDILCEPYQKSGRLYVKVRNPKTLKEREVRWYSQAEYKKMYPATVVPGAKTQKEVLGFQEGYITLIAGKGVEKLPQTRYAVPWGWYIPSTDPVPAENFICRKLFWAEVGNDKGEVIKK